MILMCACVACVVSSCLCVLCVCKHSVYMMQMLIYSFILDFLDEKVFVEGKISPREPVLRKFKAPEREVLTSTIKVEANPIEEQPPSSAPEIRRRVRHNVVVRDPRSECNARSSLIPLGPKASKTLLNILTNKPALSLPKRPSGASPKEKEQR